MSSVCTAERLRTDSQHKQKGIVPVDPHNVIVPKETAPALGEVSPPKA